MQLPDFLLSHANPTKRILKRNIVFPQIIPFARGDLTIRKCVPRRKGEFLHLHYTSARFVIRNECQLYFNQTASPICESAGWSGASNFGRNGSST